MPNPTVRRVELLIVEEDGKLGITCLHCGKMILMRHSADLWLDPIDGLLLGETIGRHECFAPRPYDEQPPTQPQ